MCAVSGFVCGYGCFALRAVSLRGSFQTPREGRLLMVLPYSAFTSNGIQLNKIDLLPFAAQELHGRAMEDTMEGIAETGGIAEAMAGGYFLQPQRTIHQI